jgi:catecholate siderophore receptor
MSTRSRLLRVAWCSVVLCGLLPNISTAQDARPDTSAGASVHGPATARLYQVEPGPLGAVLSRLADQAGVLFVADARLTQGLQSPGVQGAQGLQQAFEQALAGSGLVATQQGGRWGLRVAVAPTQAAELPPVSIQASELARGYRARRADAALRTDTPLIEVPQSVTVLPKALLDDQSPRSMAEALRWVPGVGAAQGEGNRDTPVFRGTSSTADFLFDGMRDDVQYYRDVYNVERVEVLKGPNAMLQGRGSVGGLINRVGKEPTWRTHRELSLQVGSWAQRRATLDWDQRLGDALAVRLNAMAEASHSWRDGFWMRRSGINPVIAARLSRDTRLTLGFEHFQDDRLDDRGIPSWQGRPLPTGRGSFFGNPDESVSRIHMDAFTASLEHDLGEGRSLSNRLRYAYHDKFFRNVFAGSVRQGVQGVQGLEVALSGHDSQTRRRNLFNQTDLVLPVRWGGWQHLLMTGVELGLQDGDNWRQTGFFSAGITQRWVPVSDPSWRGNMSFRKMPNDPDSQQRSESVAVYLQDQIRWSPQWQAVLGLRHDWLDTRVLDRRIGRELGSVDRLWSPRVGMIYQPVPTVSLYVNHSIGYLPRAGEQLISLNLNNQALQPEKYVNLELGAKWAVHEGLEATVAAYRSTRRNVAVADPVQANLFRLVDGQRVSGFELGLSGALMPGWQVSGGYAYQDARVLSNLSSMAVAGARLPHVPRHSVSLWNRFTLTPQWAMGVGVSHRGKVFTSTDNTVTLPEYVQLDAALYYQPRPHLRWQLNADNLLDQRYYAFAHSNNNISPGMPRALRLTLVSAF